MSLEEQMIAFITILTKEVRRFTRIWVQTLVPPVITISLYFAIFGKLIGSQINDINGFSYIQFIVPGLIMMSVITNSYMNVCSSFFSTKFQKSVEELLVSPTANTVIIWGYVSGGICRSFFTGLIVLIASLFFTDISIFSIAHLLLLFLLSSALFSLAGLANAIFAKKFDDISIIPTFILTPLTYLGGVFYPLDQLSPFWQNLSKLNPILYIINGFRYGFLGISDVSIFFSTSMLVILCLTLYFFVLQQLKRGHGLKA